MPDARGLVTIGEPLIVFATPGTSRWRHSAVAELRTAGAESNVAITVARLGGAAVWAGRVGSGGLAERVIADIRAEGVDVVPIDDEGPPSLLVKERRRADAIHVDYYRKNGPGSRLNPGDLAAVPISDARVLHLTGITPALSASARQTVFDAIDIARDARVTVSFDANYRSKLWPPHEAAPVLRDLASRADILFVGDDEWGLLAPGAADELSAAVELVARGAEEVVLKRGADGAMVLRSGDVFEQPARPTNVVDPVGAGDAFAGGYLAELLRGEAVAERLRVAALCGSFAVETGGDWEGNPSRADLRRDEQSSGTHR
ncbi:sugar kinase [Microbacterium sp. BK668]|uniref:sugar kinase n=1 Tax=Microbacterium sp. BK668 TaxID=2512118 RepID=UPI0010DA518E|nr:sugar kinase [Microbacterium sp. BK668]TDN91578.1 2-dehydro-3-deoxygluconokinase [Microbacterium sp. BK668]